ncbi:MAG: hypothetical protein ACR2PL_07475 [Dehalococcoidia bacterium]
MALVPASLLPFKAQWQEVANRQGHDSLLVCLPKNEGRARKALEAATVLLRAKGFTVTTIAAERFTT